MQERFVQVSLVCAYLQMMVIVRFKRCYQLAVLINFKLALFFCMVNIVDHLKPVNLICFFYSYRELVHHFINCGGGIWFARFLSWLEVVFRFSGNAGVPCMTNVVFTSVFIVTI